MALKQMSKKLDVNKYVKLKKVSSKMGIGSEEPVLSKVVEGRTIYRLILSEETVGGERRIECTYADGTRIHGKTSSMTHPLIVVSAYDQDEILWVAKFPFEIQLKNGNPFFRTFPAQALRGADNLYRVASGPAVYTGGKRGLHEFGAYRLIDGTLKIDTKCDYLDPHFVVDP